MRGWRRRTGLAAAALWALAASCSSAGEPPDTGLTAVVDTLPEGVVRITHPSAEAFGEEARIGLVEELRIGRTEGAGPELFGRIDGLVVTDDGTVWVLDGQVPVIRRFDPSGAYVGDVGRSGNGPGEYRQVLGMETLPDGTIALWDPGNARISIFSTDGAFVRSHRVESGLFAARTFRTDVSGHMYVRGLAPPSRSGAGSATAWSHVLIRVAPGGEVIDSIRVPPEDPDQDPFVLNTSDGSLRPFTRMRLHALSPLGYMVTGRNDRYGFDLERADGVVLRVERGHEPIAITGEERAEWEAWAAYFANAPGGRGGPVVTIPDTKPAYRDLDVDDDGRIWVERYVTARKVDEPARRDDDPRPPHSWREPRTFDLFDPEGAFLGTVEVPRGNFLLVRRGDRAWGVARDEMGVHFLVRWRLEFPRLPALPITG